MFRRGKAGDQVSGFIGKGVSIAGKLSFDGVVRIDGRFDGEIDADGTLIVGEEAVIEAKIRVDSTLISGEVRGNVEAVTKVELLRPGRLYGNVKTANLIVGEGAIFKGNSEMGGTGEADNIAPLSGGKGREAV